MRTITETGVARPRRLGRMGAYLAAGVGVGAVGTTAEAGIVTIDVSAFSGVNGGVASGANANFSLTPGGGTMQIFNYTTYRGLDGDAGLVFAYNGGNASPTNLAAGATVDSALNFTSSGEESGFLYSSNTAPNFGPGSHMGFRDALGRYGYLEVTWSSTLGEFQILSGAYESNIGVAIVIPSAAAVPEPSTLGLMALGAAGVLAARARKSKAASQADPSDQ